MSRRREETPGVNDRDKVKQQRVIGVNDIDDDTCSFGLGAEADSSPGMDSVAQNIIASLNASLGGQINQVQVGLNQLQTGLTSVQGTVAMQQLSINRLESRLSEVEKGGASSQASTMMPGDPSPKKGPQEKTDQQKATVVIGGFPFDTPRNIVEEFIRGKIDSCKEDIVDLYTPGKLCSVGKVVFSSTGTMWSFLKKMKGEEWSFEGRKIWRQTDKTPEERATSKSVANAVRWLRTQLVSDGKMSEEDSMKKVDADYRQMKVWVHVDGKVIHVFSRESPTSNSMVACDTASTLQLSVSPASAAGDFDSVL